MKILFQYRNRNTESGFTLVEMIITLAIILIVTLISVTAYQEYRKSNIDKSVQTDVNAAVVKIQTWKALHPNGEPTENIIQGITSDAETTLTLTPLENGNYEIQGTNPKGKATASPPGYVYNSIKDNL